MSFRCRSASYPDTKIGEDLPESHGEGSFSLICQKKKDELKAKSYLHCYNKSYVISFYTDTSFLLENSPLVKFLGSISGPEWRIFHIVTVEEIDDVICRFLTVVYANSR